MKTELDPEFEIPSNPKFTRQVLKSVILVLVASYLLGAVIAALIVITSDYLIKHL